jgi:hypothetical protein
MRTQLIILGLCVATNMAQAKDKDFKEKHPRRAEVNERIKNQDKRINQGVKDGTLTKAQAKELKGEEKGIKAQERAEVKANGGSLTKGEQKQLNQELNQDSKQIYAEKHAGAPAPVAPAAPAPAAAAGN